MDDPIKTLPVSIAPRRSCALDACGSRKAAPPAGGRRPSVSGLLFRFLRHLGMAARNHIGGAITQTRTAPRHANPTSPETREAENAGSAGLKPLDGAPVVVGVDLASGPDETAIYCAEYPHCGCPGGTTRPDCPALLALLDATGRVH